MSHDREWYEDTLNQWLQSIDSLWNESLGHYESGGAAAPYWDAMLIVPLAVFALKGEGWARRRIRSIVTRLCQSPPWDEAERLWNNNYQKTGFPPHGANAPIDSGLSFALRYASEIGLPDDETDIIRHRIMRSLERWAETGEHAEKYDTQVFLHRDGRLMDLIAAWKETTAKGADMDLSFVRERGPANQVCFQMRAALHAYCATRNSVFLDDMDRLWNRVLPAQGTAGGDDALPHRAIFDEDWSFRYNSTTLHNYEMSVYDLPMLGMFADVLRTLRTIGRTSPRRERFFSKWCHAALTRIELLDGSTNMVFNLYGRDRLATNENYGQSGIWLHALVSISDLTPFPPEELKYFFDAGIDRFRRWGFIKHSPDLGLDGWRESSGLEDLTWEAYEVGLMLLTNQEALSYKGVRPSRCTAGFAWKEKYFVRQTPAYHLTIVGTSPGFDGKWGIPCSGGEFVLRIPHGDYLVPLSDRGRPSLEARAGGLAFSSREMTLENEARYALRMTASTPAFGDIERAVPYAMPLYDISCDEARATVQFADSGLTLTRSFVCSRDRLQITDSIATDRGIRIERAASRCPFMTRNPRGEVSLPTGQADSLGKENRTAYLRKGETFGFRFLHYGLELRQLSEGETLIEVGEEWHEENVINCWLKMVECIWIRQPTMIRAGEETQFQYELVPLFDGHVL